MAQKIIVNGIELTPAAYENMQETGMLEASDRSADMARDVQNVRNGDVAVFRLRERCLDGADDDRREGWLDYVGAVARAAGRGDELR